MMVGASRSAVFALSLAHDFRTRTFWNCKGISVGSFGTICNGTVIGCGASLQLHMPLALSGRGCFDRCGTQPSYDSFSLRSEQRQYARPKKMFDLLTLFVVCVESAPSGAKERDISTLASFDYRRKGASNGKGTSIVHSSKTRTPG